MLPPARALRSPPALASSPSPHPIRSPDPGSERAADTASHTCWLWRRAAGSWGRQSHLALHWGGCCRQPGGVGLGTGRGCPTRVSRNCAGCRLVDTHLVPGAAGRQGGGQGAEKRGGEPRRSPGRAVLLPGFGKLGVMAIGRDWRQDSLRL